MNKKITVVMDLSSTGKNGGPHVSNMAVMNSRLKDKYNFKTITYYTEMGRFISLKRIMNLKRQLLELKPDIVHFSGLQLSGFHIAVACRLAGIKKTIVTVHGFSGDALDIGFYKRFLLTFLFEPVTILLTKKIYGVSQYVVSRKMLKLFSEKSCGYVYNLPPKIQEYQMDRQHIRETFGFDVADIVVVSVGRVTKDKGFHVLTEAINNFKEYSNLKFLIVGNGSYLYEMQEKLSEQEKKGQVIFTGYRNDVQQILPGCDIFVLPTLHETLSIALLEASMAGLPLIASDTGGVPEIVTHGENGLLIQPRDSKQMTDALIKLYEDNDLRLKFSANSKKMVYEKFDRNLIERKIDKIYQDILSNN